jgi:hypothetical protein
VNVSAQAAERRLRAHSGFANSVRSGLVVYGCVHLLVAALSLRLALTGDRTSSRGALAQLVDEPWGPLVSGALIGAFAGLALWQLLVALIGYRNLRGRRRALMRAGAACRVVGYGYLAFGIARLSVHRSSQGSGSSPRAASAGLLAQPFGRVALVICGLVVVGIGVGQVVFGVRAQFLDQLDDGAETGDRRRLIVFLGYTGYVTKGVAFAVVGLLVSWAGASNDPRKTGGLDHSLERLLGHTWGAIAVAVFGAGVGCFGLYLLARAVHFRRHTLTA